MQEEEIVLNEGVCRIPLFPFNKIKTINEKTLREFASTPIIQESMLLASASFHEEINKWLKGEITDVKRTTHIEQTLYKYISRASTRCTPFGVFSTTSYIQTTNTENINNNPIIKDNHVIQKSRLDTYSLQLLIEYFNNDETLKPLLKYTSNNSLYHLGNHLRYFETHRGNQDIYFELSEVEQNLYLEKIVSFCISPKSFIEIATSCFDNEFDSKEIFSFLDELVDSKILLSELEFNLTNPNTIEKLIFTLETRLKEIDYNIKLSNNISLTKEISEILNSCTKSINIKYQEIIKKFNLIGININAKDLIHIDSYRLIDEKINLSQSLINNLLETKKILLKLTPLPIDRFKQFKKDFSRRYGESIMPLLHVLDPETGIGYSQKNEEGDTISLLDNIGISNTSNNNNYTLTNIDIFLMNKILESQKSGNKEININPLELEKFPINIIQPDTMSIFFTLLGSNKVLLNEFSGSSAINLISRFSYLDERIKDLCVQVVNHEKECKKDSITAEIIHLPELKSGNLLLSHSLRDYEIPCVTSTQKPIEKTILLSDIQIKIINRDKIVLFSKQHKKQIIPKLSNALNYNRNSINVFRFLSDLQFQNEIPFIHFSWQGVRGFFNFFPRVKYKNIILSPAYWVVNQTELITNKSTIDFEKKLNEWVKKRGIPTFFFLSTDINDDNKLYIDLTNKIGVEVLKKELMKSNNVVLSEVLVDNNTPFLDNSKNHFNNEIILPLLRKNNHLNEKLAINTPINQPINNNVQNTFYPGTEWMSFKLYLGHKTADELIGKEISDLALQLYNESIISKWFFVRYADEDFHLRIRFFITKPEYFLTVLKKLNILLAYYIDNNIIHNVIIDTYRRELERYRLDCISYCESIFSFDSFTVCDFLSFNYNEDKRWIFGALGINAYLDDFKFNINDKVNILTFISNQFFKEFQGNKALKIQLDKKYRENSNILYDCLIDESDDYYEMVEILQKRSKMNNEAVKHVLNSVSENDCIDITLSIIHMFLNRLFYSNNREQELVLYYLLWKFYKSEQAKQIMITHN